MRGRERHSGHRRILGTRADEAFPPHLFKRGLAASRHSSNSFPRKVKKRVPARSTGASNRKARGTSPGLRWKRKGGSNYDLHADNPADFSRPDHGVDRLDPQGPAVNASGGIGAASWSRHQHHHSRFPRGAETVRTAPRFTPALQLFVVCGRHIFSATRLTE